MHARQPKSTYCPATICAGAAMERAGGQKWFARAIEVPS
jgi:hypothetical protein